MTPVEFHTLSDELLAKLRKVKLLALDVDGVLTDGRLYFSAQGDELKAFNILDGLGLKLLRDHGVDVALITGRNSPLTARRAADLKITHLYQGREDKRTALLELLGQLRMKAEHAAYVGDDLPDLGAILLAGAGMTVANGHWAVKQKAQYCTTQTGGYGAVREICDLILYAQGHLEAALKPYRDESPGD
ncbi:MAG: HAD hydrolase family protein [Hahellaceae bacterium]|nr:HAD hydrolase family protein [Hahellaceae bacterium]